MSSGATLNSGSSAVAAAAFAISSSAGSSSSSTPISTSLVKVFTPRAYVKMLMHALRYPYATVNGVLIAEKRPTSAGNGSGKSSKPSIKLVDCVPLFHSGHGLTPMVEIALTQISAYLAKKSPDYVIGGYYQMNEHFHEEPYPVPPPFAERIAEKIWEVNNEGLLLMLSNYNLATSLDEAGKLGEVYFTYGYHSGEAKWKMKGAGREVRLERPEVAQRALQQLVFGAKKAHLGLIDFDAHLEDISLDWLNPKLNSAIEAVEQQRT